MPRFCQENADGARVAEFGQLALARLAVEHQPGDEAVDDDEHQLQRQQFVMDAFHAVRREQRVEALEVGQHAATHRIVEEGRKEQHQGDVYRRDDDD